jgi:hypothetical protein
MLLVAQFPLSDARPFANDRAWRLPVPDWPAPRTFNNPQFVQHFGAATQRRKGADSAWGDEAAFCRAHHAVALPDLRRTKLGAEGAAVSVDCAFRRLFVDQSNVVVRVEVGLANARHTPLRADLGATGLLAFAESALELPVRVPDTAIAAIAAPLATQGRRLAKLYEFATTARKHRDSRAPRLVEDGLPMLVVELADGEPFPVPAEASSVDPGQIGGARAAFIWLMSSAGRLPVWFLNRGEASEAHIRSLRLCLLRLHAEQQSLDLVIKQLRRGSIQYVRDDDPGGLSDYLNQATKRISRPTWGGISQSAIVDAFGAAEPVRYDDSAGLMDRLEGARRQVAEKVDAYWRERTATRISQVFNTTGGTVNVANEQFNFSGTFNGTVVGKVEAQTIDNSFNTVAASAASPELKEALKELHEQVKGMLKDVGAVTGEAASPPTPTAPAGTPATAGTAPDAGGGATPGAPAPAGTSPAPAGSGAVLDADEVMAYLEQLTKQAIATKPVKGFLEAAAKGLVDAAKLVASRAGPITAAVTTVLKLVGVPIPF